MGDAVGLLVPPLLVAGITVVVVGRLARDSAGSRTRFGGFRLHHWGGANRPTMAKGSSVHPRGGARMPATRPRNTPVRTIARESIPDASPAAHPGISVRAYSPPGWARD